MPSMRAKLEAQLRGIGCGYVPEPLARTHIAAGRLVVKTARRAGTACCCTTPGAAEARRAVGPAERPRAALVARQLESETTRRALIEQPGRGCASDDRSLRAPTSAASRPRRPARCMPARWPRRSPWLDARAHDGRWLVRIEDVDAAPRGPCDGRAILAPARGLRPAPDAPPLWQSRRGAAYAPRSKPCRAWLRPIPAAARARDRKPLAHRQPAPRHAERVYPGTCRDGLLR